VQGKVFLISLITPIAQVLNRARFPDKGRYVITDYIAEFEITDSNSSSRKYWEMFEIRMLANLNLQKN